MASSVVDEASELIAEAEARWHAIDEARARLVSSAERLASA